MNFLKGCFKPKKKPGPMARAALEEIKKNYLSKLTLLGSVTAPVIAPAAPPIAAPAHGLPPAKAVPAAPTPAPIAPPLNARSVLEYPQADTRAQAAKMVRTLKCFIINLLDIRLSLLE